MKTFPEVPTEKYCIPAVRLFSVVNPDAAPVAVIGTQLITPEDVDCNTEDPVAGVEDGRV